MLYNETNRYADDERKTVVKLERNGVVTWNESAEAVSGFKKRLGRKERCTSYLLPIVEVCHHRTKRKPRQSQLGAFFNTWSVEMLPNIEEYL